jgi:hypothetical protein
MSPKLRLREARDEEVKGRKIGASKSQVETTLTDIDTIAIIDSRSRRKR